MTCNSAWAGERRWQESRDDLAKARELDEAASPGAPDPLVLNNLANAEGALGNWDAAIELYLQAAELNDPEVEVRMQYVVTSSIHMFWYRE